MNHPVQPKALRKIGKIVMPLFLALLSATVMSAQAKPLNPIGAPAPEPTGYEYCFAIHWEHQLRTYCRECIDVPILGSVCGKPWLAALISDF